MKAANYIIDKIQNYKVGETSPEEVIREQCTKGGIENPFIFFDEKMFEKEMNENGLICFL